MTYKIFKFFYALLKFLYGTAAQPEGVHPVQFYFCIQIQSIVYYLGRANGSHLA